MIYRSLYVLGLPLLFWLIPARSASDDIAAKYKNVPVLVTGGCGFIGSHLVKQLVDYGALVTIFDDYSTGSLENIQKVRDHVTLMQGSLTDFQMCLQATQGQKIIFHLAAFISVPQSMRDPAWCHAVNIDGTLNMLEAARMHGVERFVFSSSAAVYDKDAIVCQEAATCSPSSPYGYSKWVGELCCQEYTKIFNLPTVILRYFNVYGERQNPHGHYAAVVAKFSDCMRHNMPITIFGDGLQTRDFVPVEYVVQANLIVGMMPEDRVRGQVFNIATGTSISLLQLVELLKVRYPEWNAGIIFAPERPGDIKYSRADCAKYAALLH